MARIAIVEDDSVLCELLGSVLETEGYQSASCSRADCALDLVFSAGADVILLDIRLEETDSGWELLKLLRGDPRTEAIPVIVCSADRHAIQQNASWLLREGIPSIEKPYDLDELLELIRACLRSSRDPQTAAGS